MLKKNLIIPIIIFLLIPSVNAVIYLNETFESGSLTSPNIWGIKTGGNISLNTTAPIFGSYSGWDNGSSWGQSYTNLSASAAAGNITFNLHYQQYADESGFIIAHYRNPDLYDQSFFMLCGFPFNNYWGFYDGSYKSTNFSCAAGSNWNISGVVFDLGATPRLTLCINNTCNSNITGNNWTGMTTGGAFSSVESFGTISRLVTSKGMIDNLCVCSGTWNTTCCDAAAAGGGGEEVFFLNQTPTDILSTSLFSSNVFILYNYSNTTGINNTYLNYSVTSTAQNCINVINGSCIIANNTFYQMAGINTSSANNQTIYNFTLGENNLLPANNQLNYSYFNQTHNLTSLTSNNILIKSKFINVSNYTQYSFYEAMLTGTCTLYYCNSSYSTGNPGASNYCAQMFTGNITYNHSHNSYSNHSLFTIGINTTTGKTGGVYVTPTSYIISRGTPSTCQAYWVANTTGAGILEYSSNTGSAYTEINGTLDNHLHQFSNETLNYSGCQNKSGVINCTTFRSDNYGLDPLAPGGANIINPTENQEITKYINLTFIRSTSPINATISQYNLSLLNSDYTFNRTIAGNLTKNETIYNITNLTITSTAYINAFNITNIYAYIKNSSIQVKINNTAYLETRIKYYYIDETTAYSNTNRTTSTTYGTASFENPNPDKMIINYTIQAYIEFAAGDAGLINNSNITTRSLINITLNPDNISAIIDIHAYNLTIGTHYLEIETTDNNSRSTSTIQLFNLTRDITLTTRAYSAMDSSIISNFTQKITDLTTLTEEEKNSSENYTEFYLIKSRNYTSVTSAINYSYDIYNLTTTTATSSFINYSALLYTNNSVSIYIYDLATLALLNGTNVSIRVTGATSATYSTSNGTYYLDGLTDGNYTLKFTATNYSIKYYNIEVANSSHQFLYVYLISGDYSTIFTIQSALTSLAIEGATFTAEILNATTYVLVESLTSDLSGKVQMYYIAGEKYRFTISATGYSTKLFYLNPIIFSAYVVNLDPTTNTESLQDYSDISVVYYPKTFYNNETQNFTWLISSPLGRLTNYSFLLEYPTATNNGSSGVNAYGESFIISVNITGANRGDRVNLTYNYTTTSGGTKTFLYSFEILNTGEGNYTIARLKTKDYGLGAFEKTLMVMLVMVLICGFAYFMAGMAGSLFLGMVIMGVAVYLGFLPIWAILLSVVLGVAIVLRLSTGGQT